MTSPATIPARLDNKAVLPEYFWANIPKKVGNAAAAHTRSATKNKYSTDQPCIATRIAKPARTTVKHLPTTRTFVFFRLGLSLTRSTANRLANPFSNESILLMTNATAKIIVRIVIQGG